MNCPIQCVRNNACCGYKAVTNVISSGVSDIEQRNNQNGHGCCSPLGMSRLLDDIDLWKSIIIANLSFQCSGLALKLVGDVNQNASDQHKDYGGNNLKHKNSVDLKCRGEWLISLVRKSRRQGEEYQWSKPRHTNQQTRASPFHQRGILERFDYGNKAIRC